MQFQQITEKMGTVKLREVASCKKWLSWSALQNLPDFQVTALSTRLYCLLREYHIGKLSHDVCVCVFAHPCTGLCKIFDLLDKPLISFKIWKKLRHRLELNVILFFPYLHLYYPHPSPEEKLWWHAIYCHQLLDIFSSPFTFNGCILSDPNQILQYPWKPEAINLYLYLMVPQITLVFPQAPENPKSH